MSSFFGGLKGESFHVSKAYQFLSDFTKEDLNIDEYFSIVNLTDENHGNIYRVVDNESGYVLVGCFTKDISMPAPTVYATAAEFKTKSGSKGDIGFATDTKEFYGWDGTKWNLMGNIKDNFVIAPFTSDPELKPDVALNGYWFQTVQI